MNYTSLPSTLKWALIFFISLSIITFPLIAHADLQSVLTNGLVPCGNESDPNAAANSCDFEDAMLLVQNLLDIMFYIALLVTVGLIIYTGFLFLTAGEKPAQVAKAKSMFKTVGIGFLLMFGAYLIIGTLIDILLSPTSGITNPLSTN